MDKECIQLFEELFDYSDDPCIMNEFVEAMKRWVIDWNKGNIKICLINLNELDNNFQDGLLYIAYDDCSGSCFNLIWTTENFIKYIVDIYNEYSEDLNPEEYWIETLKAILMDGYRT